MRIFPHLDSAFKYYIISLDMKSIKRAKSFQINLISSKSTTDGYVKIFIYKT